MNEEQSKLRKLVTEAVSVLCKNGLTYEHEVCVEGLLGITTDNQDVFLISLNQIIKHEESSTAPSLELSPSAALKTSVRHSSPAQRLSSQPGRPRTSQRKRLHPSVSSLSTDSVEHTPSQTPPLRISAVSSINNTCTDEPATKRVSSAPSTPQGREDTEKSQMVKPERLVSHGGDEDTNEETKNQSAQVSVICM